MPINFTDIKMSLITTMHYGYNDVTIIPERISDVKSRREVYPYNEEGMLPIFTAPMDSIVNEENIDKWSENHIIPILPRNIDATVRKNLLCDKSFYQTPWVAVSLQEFDSWLNSHEFYTIALPKNIRVVIDIANGHMRHTLDIIKEAKQRAKDNDVNLVVMAGNIANPKAYLDYCRAGVDYVRLGIGAGSMCTTTSNTGVHYPMASLISECVKFRGSWEWDHSKEQSTKIVADGGIRNYSDAIKALALGADYVMIGGLFSAMLESAAEIEGELPYTFPSWTEPAKRQFIRENDLYKTSHGMSTREAQKNIDKNAITKTAEGITIKQPIKYTINQWVENFTDYLRSAMSYTSSHNLEEFKESTVIVNSPAAQMSVNK